MCPLCTSWRGNAGACGTSHLCFRDDVLNVLQQNVSGQGRHDAAHIGCGDVRDKSVHGCEAYDARMVFLFSEASSTTRWECSPLPQ